MANPTVTIESTRADRKNGKVRSELKKPNLKLKGIHTMSVHAIAMAIFRLARRLGGCGGCLSWG